MIEAVPNSSDNNFEACEVTNNKLEAAPVTKESKASNFAIIAPKTIATLSEEQLEKWRAKSPRLKQRLQQLLRSKQPPRLPKEANNDLEALPEFMTQTADQEEPLYEQIF